MGQFGSKKTPAEMLRESKRVINRAVRELDRERLAMERQEQKLIQDIKKMAKDNQMVRMLFCRQRRPLCRAG